MFNNNQLSPTQFKTIESLLKNKEKLCKIGKTILKHVFEANLSNNLSNKVY